jgi:sugar lactone lactonase YvrE
MPVSAVVMRERGGYALAARDGFLALDPTSGETAFLAEVERENSTNRMNDGKVDPAGRFWAGTMSEERIPRQGSLYRLDPDCSVHIMQRSVTTSNGLDWTADGTRMYYIDTGTRRVDAFDFDMESGEIGGRQALIDVPVEWGKPDGMTLDAEGCLWVAFWDGGAIRHFTPEGKLLETVTLPADRVTSCTFGGPRYETLYITSAMSGLAPERLERQPHAGGLFACRPSVGGRPPRAFAG